MKETEIRQWVEGLPFWDGKVALSPLEGGITNLNFRAEDRSGVYAVRVGSDIPEHHVMRFNELSACYAAQAAEISPAVRYHEPNVTVSDFIDGHTLTPKDVQDTAMLDRIVDLIGHCHRDLPLNLRGPALIFWVFHVIRDYAAFLAESGSNHIKLLPDLVKIGNGLEQAAGPFDIVFGHNDLLARNIIDDGQRLWLIDFDYAGFNTPLFDLGGLASNNKIGEGDERRMLTRYFGKSPDDALIYRYNAMKCASLLRETMWSMVSEIKSRLEFDYAAYTSENLDRFRAAYRDFQNA